ncbi:MULTISPECIES: response regulator [Niastella]|uniref:Response regulator n=1 Tax=Niastella soli TaxID=2821487 RepID=A0ABS3Z4Q7_9BACT|nr:response regulator [Niastella soli]MBO9205147.1 response regulator [Niastella soli]
MGESVLAHRHILIVDDDVRNTYALVSYLETHDMEIYTAGNGYGALEMLQRYHEIELVLMDIMMPGIDGYETMRRIRNNLLMVELPIIAVTANAMIGDREKCLSAGATDYISKPLNLKALLEKMEQLVGIPKNSMNDR